MKILPRLLARLMLVSAALTAAGAAPPVDVTLTAGWADNISRTSAAPTKKDAALYSAEFSTAWHRQVARDWQVAADASLEFSRVPDFRALDTVRAGATATLRRKFGLGPMAPVLDFIAGATRADLRENGRSGWEVSAGVRAAKRLTDTWRVAVAGDWQEFYASHHPFDVRQRRLTLETSWDATERWQLGAGAGRLWGDLTANAAGAVYATALAGGFGGRIRDYYRAIPWETSHTYGPGWVAYRVDCRADFWWLSVSPALSDDTSVPLRYEEYEVVNRVGVHYKTRIVTLSLLHRF